MKEMRFSIKGKRWCLSGDLGSTDDTTAAGNKVLEKTEKVHLANEKVAKFRNVQNRADQRRGVKKSPQGSGQLQYIESKRLSVKTRKTKSYYQKNEER